MNKTLLKSTVKQFLIKYLWKSLERMGRVGVGVLQQMCITAGEMRFKTPEFTEKRIPDLKSDSKTSPVQIATENV